MFVYSQLLGSSFSRFKSICTYTAFLVLLCVAPMKLGAQATSSSSVVGQVTDQQGAPVPGTQVKLLDRSTNNQQITASNTDGRYVFVNVPAGGYNLVFTKAGFETSRVDNQQVEIGSSLTINTTFRLVLPVPRLKYRRSWALNLALQPLGSYAYDKDIIPYYEEHFGDANPRVGSHPCPASAAFPRSAR